MKTNMNLPNWRQNPTQRFRYLNVRIVLVCFALAWMFSGPVALFGQQSLLPTRVEDNRNGPALGAPRTDNGVNDGLRSLTPRELYDQSIHGIVWIYNVTNGGDVWKGTGFVIDLDRRLIMTNEHVISDAKEVYLYFPHWENGRLLTDASEYIERVESLNGTVIDSDKYTDLAIVQADSIPEGTIELPLATHSPLPADRVHTIGGNPLGTDSAFVYCNGSVRGVATGYIATGFDVEVTKLETDMDINGGNSGGAILNDFGQVVGVVEGAQLRVGNRDVNDVTYGLDITEVHRYLGELLPLLPADTASKLITFGDRHFFEGRYEVAINCYDNALAMDPNLANAYADRGWCYYELGNYQQALADFNQAIDLGVNTAEDYHGRAFVYEALDRMNLSLADYNTAIELAPADPNGYSLRGEVYYNMGEYELAVQDFSEAIALDPENSSYLLSRADALQEAGDFEAGFSDIAAALDIDPNNAYAFFLGAYGFLYTGDAETAQEWFFTAHQLDESAYSYLTWLGDAARINQELDLSVNAYTASISIYDQDAWAYYGRGLVYQAAGQSQQARSDFQQAEALYPGITSLAPRGSQVVTNSNRANNRIGGSTNDSLLPGAVSGNRRQDGSSNQQAANQNIVGIWYTQQTVEGVQVEIWVAFESNGSYATRVDVHNQYGGVNQVMTEGVYEFDGSTLATAANDGTQDSGPCKVRGNQMTLFISDLGTTLLFDRIES